jgi:hypothetical protein
MDGAKKQCWEWGGWVPAAGLARAEAGQCTSLAICRSFFELTNFVETLPEDKQ